MEEGREARIRVLYEVYCVYVWVCIVQRFLSASFSFQTIFISAQAYKHYTYTLWSVEVIQLECESSSTMWSMQKEALQIYWICSTEWWEKRGRGELMFVKIYGHDSFEWICCTFCEGYTLILNMRLHIPSNTAMCPCHTFTRVYVYMRVFRWMPTHSHAAYTHPSTHCYRHCVSQVHNINYVNYLIKIVSAFETPTNCF